MASLGRQKQNIQTKAVELTKAVEDAAKIKTEEQDEILVTLRKDLEDATKEAAEKERVLKEMAAKLAPSTVASVVAAGIAPNVTMVPSLPGSIIHSNDISPEQMLSDMQQAPELSGAPPELAALIVQWTLTYMKTKATEVTAAVPTAAASQQQQDQFHAAQDAAFAVGAQLQQQAQAGAAPTQTDQETLEELSDIDLSEDEAEAVKATAKPSETVILTKKVPRQEKLRLVAQRTKAAKKADTKEEAKKK